jgi:FkbM family methyltransferase
LFSFNITALGVKTLVVHPISFISFLRNRSRQSKEFTLTIQPLRVKQTHGFEILIDPRDPGVSSSIILFGMAEPCVSEIFKRITKPGMTVLDIGANIGWYSLLGAKLVGRDGKVISVEPEPTNFSILSQSIALNRFQNIELVNACMTNKAGTVKLNLSYTNPGGHSIVCQSDHYIECQGITVDSIMEKQGKIDVLKIDAESAEPLVLQGADKLLNASSPLDIIMEYSPLAWKGYETLQSGLLDKFQMFKINSSPFLLRRVAFKDLPTTRQSMLYLRRN